MMQLSLASLFIIYIGQSIGHRLTLSVNSFCNTFFFSSRKFNYSSFCDNFAPAFSYFRPGNIELVLRLVVIVVLIIQTVWQPWNGVRAYVGCFLAWL